MQSLLKIVHRFVVERHLCFQHNSSCERERLSSCVRRENENCIGLELFGKSVQAMSNLHIRSVLQYLHSCRSLNALVLVVPVPHLPDESNGVTKRDGLGSESVRLEAESLNITDYIAFLVLIKRL